MLKCGVPSLDRECIYCSIVCCFALGLVWRASGPSRRILPLLLLLSLRLWQLLVTMNFDFRRRPRIQIDLDQPSVYTYTTGDRIDGTVSVTVDQDVQFDDIEITFEGMLY